MACFCLLCCAQQLSSSWDEGAELDAYSFSSISTADSETAESAAELVAETLWTSTGTLMVVTMVVVFSPFFFAI